MNYTDINIDSIKKWLKENLCEEKYLHSLGVMDAAEELAIRYNIDVEKAKIAGLIHDCAKCLPNEELLDLMKNKYKAYEECELINPKTWHAPVGAYVAQNELGIEDAEILSAIRWHTLGRVGMTDFEKIIYLADKIEQNTRDHKCRSEVITFLNEDKGLDKAILKCFQITIESLMKRNLTICHQTIDVYNELLVKTAN